jgi:hypothetical protein
MLQHVFISYRHETPEHARAVRRLGELLRQARIPVALDQFYLEDHPGGPDSGGWPKWSEDCANQSACVLIIASEGWFAAYDKTGAPAKGLGAATEADVLRQWLYDEKGDNDHIRVAFLHEIGDEKVPRRLRAWHQFRPFISDDQLDQLIRWIANRLRLVDVEVPRVRWPEALDFRPNLADRSKEEWPAIVELLAGRSRERILLYEGASGLGKSTLVRQAAIYAKGLGIPVVHVDLKGGGVTVEDILGQFDLDLSRNLPNFTREGATKTHLLRKDLRNLRQPVLIIFDTYEGSVANKAVVDWLNQHFFAEVETALGLAVIVAGQQIPHYGTAGWRDMVRHLPLSPIMEMEHWKPWVEQHYPDFQRKGADLNTVMMFAQGNPAVVSSACEAISKS